MSPTRDLYSYNSPQFNELGQLLVRPWFNR